MHLQEKEKNKMPNISTPNRPGDKEKYERYPEAAPSTYCQLTQEYNF